VYAPGEARRRVTPDASDDKGRGEEALRAKLAAHMARSLEFALPPPAGVDDTPRRGDDGLEASTDQQAAKEDEFEFRLFSTASASKVLLPPEVGPGAGADGHEAEAVRLRPVTFYVPGPPDEASWGRFRAAALSGEEVLAMSKQRCWGLEVPWRVTKVTASKKDLRALADAGGGPETIVMDDSSSGDEGKQDGAQKRKRPGKKRRIALRTKDKAEKEKAALQMSKEEHLREKKKRLNREKKLKRRQKERDKKAAKGDHDDSGGETDSA